MAENETNKLRTRTIQLRPEDDRRLGLLQDHYQKDNRTTVKEIDALRFALEDACIALGLEQRKASSVEPIEGTS